MIEQKMRSALLLLAGSLLAAGAWGQTVILTQNSPVSVKVASDYFGSADGREVTFDGEPKEARINLLISGDPRKPAGSGVSAIASGNEATLTFTLNGASFASSVRASDLEYYDLATSAIVPTTYAADGRVATTIYQQSNESNDIRKSVTAGGRRGDRSVTFNLEVVNHIVPANTERYPATGTDFVTGNAGAEFLSFVLPSLQVTPAPFNPLNPFGPSGVTVEARLAPGSSGANPFPRSVVGTTGRVLVPGVPGNDGPDGTPGNADDVDPIAAQLGVNPVDDGKVLELASAMTVGLAGDTTAEVLLSERKVIVSSGTNAGVGVVNEGGSRTRGLLVGRVSLRLTTDPNVYVLRGDNPVVDVEDAGDTADDRLDGSLSGTLDVTVSGTFQVGDRMLLGADQTEGDAKVLEMSDSVATIEFPLTGNIAAMDLIYVPGGVADLRPGNFAAAATLSFNDPLNASRGLAVGSLGRLKYRGIDPSAYAYGVSRANDEEVTSFLRTTCDGVNSAPSAGCRIFIDCTGEDGTSYFGDLTGTDEIVSRSATRVFTSLQIAEALGGGWDSGGSGRCELLSNGSLQVQHMIRTSGNALHNNSVVIGKPHRSSTSPGTVGLLGDVFATPTGGASVALRPGERLSRLSDGRIFGTFTAINAIASSLGLTFTPIEGSSTVQCGYIGLDRMVEESTSCDPPSNVQSLPLMTGDVIYPATRSHGVYRPTSRTLANQGYIATPVASSGAPVLSP